MEAFYQIIADQIIIIREFEPFYYSMDITQISPNSDPYFLGLSTKRHQPTTIKNVKRSHFVKYVVLWLIRQQNKLITGQTTCSFPLHIFYSLLFILSSNIGTDRPPFFEDERGWGN